MASLGEDKKIMRHLIEYVQLNTCTSLIAQLIEYVQNALEVSEEKNKELK